MIDVQDVSYRYPGGSSVAVEHVEAAVQPGEVVGIVGPNGSGKSTLGRLIKGLLLPTAGCVCIDGMDSAVDGLGVRRRVGLVFQNPNSQIVNSVVEQEIAFGPENVGLPTEEIRERVEGALRAVGLSGRESDECHALSMADKQRIAIASVIAMLPDYIVLDEATAWIEPSSRWSLLGEVLRWRAERQAGVVLITPRMDEALLCQRLYGMLDGRVLITGSPEEVLQNEAARTRLALDVPETYVLAARLREAGLPARPGVAVDRLADVLSR